MRKYKVGDFVIIKENLANDGSHNLWVSRDMLSYRGRKARIIRVDQDGDYELCIDGCNWAWEDSMFRKE